MGMYEQFRVDPKVENEGVKLDYGDFRVTITRAHRMNKRFQRLMDQKLRPHRRAIQSGVFGDDNLLEVTKEVYAEAIVTCWEVRRDGKWDVGIEMPDGTIGPFTPANVLGAFLALPDLYDDIFLNANSFALFKAASDEVSGKNL